LTLWVIRTKLINKEKLPIQPIEAVIFIQISPNLDYQCSLSGSFKIMELRDDPLNHHSFLGLRFYSIDKGIGNDGRRLIGAHLTIPCEQLQLSRRKAVVSCISVEVELLQPLILLLESGDLLPQ